MARLTCLLALLGCVAAALANPIVFQKDCAQGPEVWCENLKTASHCNAVKHCQQNVWNKPTVESIPCELCKEIVTVAGKFLKNNDTEEEIHAYMSKACEFLSDQGLVSECKEMVDSYLPNILDMIKGEFDNPGVVCNALTLCQSLQKHLASVKLQKQLQSNKIPELDFSELASPFMANVPLLLYPQEQPKEKSQGSGDVCKDCVQLVTDVQEAVKSNSSFVQRFIQHALEECEHLAPSMVDQCKDYISQYSDLAIQLFVQMSPQSLCSMVGFCSSFSKSVPLQTLVPAKAIHELKAEPLENSPSQAESLSLCDACEIMVEEVASLLESNKSEEEIVHAMEAVCAVLPVKLRDECKSFVEVYGKAIIDMLLEATDPKMVCVMLKCCANKAVPAEKIAPVQSPAGDVCDLCKMIVAYLDKQLLKNATTEEIEEALEKVCSMLPQSYRDQCDQFVEDYEPMAVQLLAEMMDPGFVCGKLGVCAASTKPLLGSEMCVWGPGYWCKNMETATKCNAVDHCKHHVWN
ncbi:PREDICTED: prosaposin isoform X2 [Gekko japonicus]|uniref:Prosaposin n=1 Tax=Gekko japonicus TaxID=146911 RepID=A0ABM1KXF7_GEKJA|nr:PREDICTED: prosaposin isoform X2 [Gekko japonicus]